ncbi:MAG: DEAD/DEAH box helicase [Hydrogenophaga sp.]|uniref:DEAD/DEAH box helicase n=1 Tax=Hydrogenophaga intermedia TaxID=65786 RepID=UPI0020431106|nr:DEAD/DEAH box helicase [Hydrogenophaga intermedia]MCM3565230.1 DEAD/DEAH box helicase [Hydrogenophaga intermedia]
MNFAELNLAPAIVQAVHEHGYDTPTPIQIEAIPAVLAGRDLLAGAQTGTGKTAAFTLPMLQRLSQGERPRNRFGGIGIRALVLTPTRELAAQVEESVRVYGKHVDLKSTVVFGGVGMNPQIDAMKRGVDILVATPGRLLDLQQQGFLDLAAVQVLVLDEADRMLDMGFIHDVKKVLALLPKSKQSLLFSATFSDEIRELANGLLKDPQHIQVTPPNTTVQRITQLIHPVGRGKKKALLVHIIQLHNWSQVLVFTRTKFGANNVADYLNKQGISAMALHGNKSQGARTQALAGFKSGEIRALVATDIAARGIDIDELPHVVNYDIPNICEDYVHRIGRTGRAGREGHAINLVSLDEEGFMMEIERFTKQQIPVEMFPEYMPEPGEKAEPIAMGRQTLWGGAGKPPSRDVMAAAAKAARQEMVQRIREKKGNEGQGRGEGQGQGQPRGQGQKARGPRPNGGGGGQPQGRGHGQGNGPGNGPGAGQQRQRPPRGDRPPRFDGDEGNERQPGPNAHLGSLRIRDPKPRQASPDGQPDPLRTGIDAMRTGNRRNKKRGGKGGGQGGGGGGVDPLRTNYGRIGNR